MDILEFVTSRPEVIWILAFTGAVCVIGVVDYLKNFFDKKKNKIRWVVLIVSLLIAIILSPITPTLVTTIVIIWLLILALATIGKQYIIDGIGGLINRIIGSMGTLNNNNSQRSDRDGRSQ